MVINKDKLNLKKYLWPLAFILFLVFFYFFLYKDLSRFSSFAYADTNPFHSLVRSLSIFLNCWWPTSLGLEISTSFHVIIFGFFSWLVGDATFFQKIFLFSLQPLSSILMWVFLKKKKLINSSSVLFLASFFYGFNPIVVAMFIIGAINYLFLYALQPIFLLLLFNFFRKDKKEIIIKAVIPFSLLITLASFARDAIVVESLIFLIIFIYYYIIKEKTSSVFSSLGYYLLSLVNIFFLSCFYYLFLFKNFLQSLFSYVDIKVLSNSNLSSNILDFVGRTYEKSGMLNNFILSGIHADWFSQIYPNRFFPLLFLVPLISFITVLIIKNKEKRKIVLFFLLLSLFFISLIFIIRQSGSFVFKLIPPFVIFRESYKLLSVFALPLIVLFALGLDGIIFYLFKIRTITHRRLIILRTSQIIFIILILSVVFLPLIDFMTGNIRLTDINKNRYSTVIDSGSDLDDMFVPPRYFKIAESINHAVPMISKSIWLPIDRNILTKIQTLTDSVVLDMEGYKANDNYQAQYEYTRDLFDKIMNDQLNMTSLRLALANVNYVVVDKKTKWDGKLRPGWADIGLVGSAKLLIDRMDKIKVLEPIENNEDFNIYRIKTGYYTPIWHIPARIYFLTSINSMDNYDYNVLIDNKPPLFLTNDLGLNNNFYDLSNSTIEFKQISPSKYRLRLHGVRGTFPLVFLESFSKQWKIYPTTDHWLANHGDQSDSGFVSQSLKGTIQNDNLPVGNIFETWLKKPISIDAGHLLADGYANSWIINTEEVCQKTGNCSLNSDETYDIELVAEFGYQKFLYLGLIVALLTMFINIIYFIYVTRTLKK